MMTTEQLVKLTEEHISELQEDEERCKDALRALQGHKKPGRRPNGAAGA